MRKKLVLYAIIFIIGIIAVKSADIMIRYDISLLDYIRFSAPLNEEEMDRLKGGLKYGVDADNSPFSFISDETDQSTGIIVDYFNQLAVVLETDLKPELYNAYYRAVKVKTEDIDMAVLNKNALNESVFDFTQDIYTERSKVLVDGEASYESISDIKDISIAVISGSAAHHAANKFFREENNVEIVLTESLDESFFLLGMGQVDAIIGDEARISYHLNQALRSNRFKFVEGSVSEENVAIAVNKNDPVLLSILNKGILIMKKNDQYSHINTKWFGSFIPEINESTGNGMTANAVSFVVFLFGIFFLWNQSVANKVNVRTRELNESRQNLRNLIDSLSEGIIVSDKNGVIKAANRTVMNILGMTEYKDLIDHKIDEIEGLKPFTDRANQPDAFFYDGKYYLVYSRQLSEDSVEDMLIIDDYTDRHKYESLNRQEAKMIAVGELTAGLAHEIRNPLGLIKNYLFLLKKKISGDNEHAISVMDDSVNRINRLIENMLGFSKLSMEEASFINLRDSISSVVDLERDNLEKKHIALQIDFDSSVKDRVKINEDVLRLCIVNMIKNSLDAFEESDRDDKRISIRSSIQDEDLVLIFEDNASGIPRDKLDQIFDPFYTTKANGTGLGLYILQSELYKINGGITVDSIEGEGTTFSLRIPVEEEKDDDRS